MNKQRAVKIVGQTIWPGKKEKIAIPVASLPGQAELSLPVTVLHGKKEGPCLWLSAAIHGDEVNGIEIIHQVLEKISAAKLCGTLITVPVVNIFGFIHQSRYLPDRRDLNRCFPGSPKGSLASRLAYLFMSEIALKCDYGIDLHTAASPRTNLPQIRANLKDPATKEFAKAFAAPVMIHSTTRDGSLRQAAMHKGIKTLLYEAGEPLRFNSDAIEVGVCGVLRCLEFLQMYPKSIEQVESLEISKTKWVRANCSGIFDLQVKLGEVIENKQIIGYVKDVLGEKKIKVKAPWKGMVIGHNQNPLVYKGDAVVHLAQLV